MIIKQRLLFQHDMAEHRIIGFLYNEQRLKGVDDDFRELVVLMNQIYGFGTYGVSSSGHFREKYRDGKFYPEPWGRLGVLALPETEHIKELIGIIYDSVKADADGKIRIPLSTSL